MRLCQTDGPVVRNQSGVSLLGHRLQHSKLPRAGHHPSPPQGRQELRGTGEALRASMDHQLIAETNVSRRHALCHLEAGPLHPIRVERLLPSRQCSLLSRHIHVKIIAAESILDTSLSFQHRMPTSPLPLSHRLISAEHILTIS